MKYNLIFYGIGFLILIVSNVAVNNMDSNSDYQMATFKRCLEIQKTLNGDLKKCMSEKVENTRLGDIK